MKISDGEKGLDEYREKEQNALLIQVKGDEVLKEKQSQSRLTYSVKIFQKLRK
jgi:hypothetical protein